MLNRKRKYKYIDEHNQNEQEDISHVVNAKARFHGPPLSENFTRTEEGGDKFVDAQSQQNMLIDNVDTYNTGTSKPEDHTESIVNLTRAFKDF